MAYAWRGTVGELKSLENSGELLTQIEDTYTSYYGPPAESELRSWQQSLPALLGTLADPAFDSLQIVLELQMPVGAERADVILLGGSSSDTKAMVIELKQWSRITGNAQTHDVYVPALRDQRHPSIQALNYAGKLRFFNARAHDYDFSAAAFLHNASSIDRYEMTEKAPHEWTAQAPIFIAGEGDRLAEHVAQHLLPTHLEPTEVEQFTTASYDQSRHLFSFLTDHADEIAADAEAALAGTGMGLTSSQALIKTEVLAALESGETKDFIVQGGPGSGKTLLAVSLLLRAAALEKSTLLAMRNNRLMAILRQVLDRAYPGASGCTLFFETRNNGGIAQKPISADLIICDEAQRMRDSNPAAILPKGKVTVTFLDETQRLNPPEQGTIRNVANASANLGRAHVIRELPACVRCLGGDAYHTWVEKLLASPGAARAVALPDQPWQSNYQLSVADSVSDLVQYLAGRVADGNRVAMVASFTESPGKMSNPRHKDNLRIGYPLTSGFDLYRGQSVNIPWLMSPSEYRSFWYGGASNNLEKVASIYGAQGFESDYVGVIWGRDLVMRHGKWVLGNPEVCYDTIDGLVSRSRRWHTEALELMLNRYRIFLTRGIKGTIIFCEDVETGQYFNGLALTA